MKKRAFSAIRVSSASIRSFMVFALMLWFALGDGAQASDNSRVWKWKTKDGHAFRGRFVRLEESMLILARDGWEFAVPVTSLSPKSLDLARKQGVWGSAMHSAPSERPPAATLVGIPAVIHATLAALPAIPASTPAVPAPLPPPIAAIDYRRSILTYCQDHIGDRVGTGQCGMLAAVALKNAGAANRGPDWPEDGDYVWGKEVAFVEAGFFGLKGVESLAQVQPGDIVQFHETRFTGFTHSMEGEYQYEAHHHTAVIESVDPVRKTMSVLHQNWNGRQYVQRETLFLRGMSRGWLRFYRPVSTAG